MFGEDEIEGREVSDAVHLRVICASWCISVPVPIIWIVRDGMQKSVHDCAVKLLHFPRDTAGGR